MQTYGKLVLTLPNAQELEYALAKTNVTLGRSAMNDVVLRDDQVAPVHARIERADAGCVLLDLQSANGTRLNGARVERTPLSPGDVITLGQSLLRFETTPLRPELKVIPIHSEVDLETTLAQANLPMRLSETRTPRVAVHTSEQTWEVPLTQDALTIGRESGSDIVLSDAAVSLLHARIERHGEDWLIRDQHSQNGTWRREQPIETWTLREGDTIRIGSARLIFKRGFDKDDLQLPEQSPDNSSTLSPRLPVVVVPGVMGSELWRGSECIWPCPRDLFTWPEIYSFGPDQSVDARGLAGEAVIVPNLIRFEAYGRVGDYLEESLGYARGKDLNEFPYDWRQDVRVSAQQLAAAIEGWNVQAPIVLVAHDLGCLVSRYYVERLGGKERVGQLVLIGGPHRGMPKIITSVLSSPDLLPFGLLGERLRQVLMTFPSTYQLLPTYACVFDQSGQPIDLLQDDSWIPSAHIPLLRNAREFFRELGGPSSVPAVSVFGYGLETVTNATIERDQAGEWHKLDFGIQPRGDSILPAACAVLEGSEIYPVSQYHGSLFADNDVKMRLKWELTRPRG